MKPDFGKLWDSNGNYGNPQRERNAIAYLMALVQDDGSSDLDTLEGVAYRVKQKLDRLDRKESFNCTLKTMKPEQSENEYSEKEEAEKQFYQCKCPEGECDNCMTSRNILGKQV